jgi:hypothetical protein
MKIALAIEEFSAVNQRYYAEIYSGEGKKIRAHFRAIANVTNKKNTNLNPSIFLH